MKETEVVLRVHVLVEDSGNTVRDAITARAQVSEALKHGPYYLKIVPMQAVSSAGETKEFTPLR